jgi:predicted transcriptional regulator
MAITVTFTFDADTVNKLESLSLSRKDTKSAILRDLVAKEFAASNQEAVLTVSAETEAGSDN